MMNALWDQASQIQIPNSETRCRRCMNRFSVTSKYVGYISKAYFSTSKKLTTRQKNFSKCYLKSVKFIPNILIPLDCVRTKKLQLNSMKRLVCLLVCSLLVFGVCRGQEEEYDVAEQSPIVVSSKITHVETSNSKTTSSFKVVQSTTHQSKDQTLGMAQSNNSHAKKEEEERQKRQKEEQERQRVEQERQKSEQERQRREQQQRQKVEQERQKAEQERQRIEQERQRKEHEERQRAEQERQRREQERQRREQERQRAEQDRQRRDHEQRQRAEQERQRAEQERQRRERERQQQQQQQQQNRKSGRRLHSLQDLFNGFQSQQP